MKDKKLNRTTSQLLLSLCVVLGSSIAREDPGVARNTDATDPSRFYVVTQTSWDNGPSWDYHILEAKQVGTDTLVRDIIIMSEQSPCGPSCTVRARTKQLHNTTPGQLVGDDNNPCAIHRRELRREHRRTKRALKHTLLFSFTEFGIVATCDGEETVLHLPLLPFPAEPHGSPRIQRAYTLLHDVETRAFGTSEVFKPVGETKIFEDLDAEPEARKDESEGAALVPELRAGVFDKALAEDCKKPGCEDAGLKHVLETYTPPQERVAPSVAWVDRPPYECLKCVLPAYPPLARLTHIEGDVELDLQIGARTGLVLGATVTSGHQLLQRAAIQAARGWQFQPQEHTEGARTSKVRLRFSMNCQQTKSPTAE